MICKNCNHLLFKFQNGNPTHSKYDIEYKRGLVGGVTVSLSKKCFCGCINPEPVEELKKK